MKKQSKLQQLITTFGDEKFAKVAGIKPRSARAYRCGARNPRLKTARKIIARFARRPEGPLSIADMYNA